MELSLLGQLSYILAFGFLTITLFNKQQILYFRVGVILLLIPLGLIIYGYVCDCFSLFIVQQHSSQNTPLLYKICALWSSHEGSFATFTSFLAIVFFLLTHAHACFIRPAALALLPLTLFILLSANPFSLSAELLPDGYDLNPSLQDMSLLIHPPILYFGQCALASTFLLCFKPFQEFKNVWFIVVNVAWFGLTLGISLGAFWAYYELGWGGFWFWDPVENLALLQWLYATLLLHALIFKDEFITILLGRFSLFLVIICTCLIRSGILVSVHSFAMNSSTVWMMIVLILFQLLITLFIPFQKNNYSFKKNYFFTFQLLCFLTAKISIIIGVLWPIIQKDIHIQETFYYYTVGISFLILLLIQGVYFGFRSSNQQALLYGALSAGLLTILISLYNHFSWLGAFMLGGVIFSGGILLTMISHLPLRTSLAHGGLCFIIFGAILSKTLEQEEYITLQQGQKTFAFGKTFWFKDLNNITTANYNGHQYVLEYDGYIFKPEHRIYKNNQVDHLETFFKSFLMDHHYLSARTFEGKNIFYITIKPFINLLWLGCALMVIAGIPNLKRRKKMKVR